MENKNIGWVVQQNFSSDRYVYDKFKNIFDTHKIEHDFINVIPFDTNLPEFNKERINIFYGSITTVNTAYKDVALRPGIFFDPDTFKMDNYIDKWGKLMLNCDAKILTLKEVSQLEGDPETLFFIRPNDDSKSFAGQIMKQGELKIWRDKIFACNTDQINDETVVLLGEPYKINKEWRTFVVNGKVVASSRYMKNNRLNKDGNDAPEEMIAFCEKACHIYTPHDVFVMDIAETGGDYYILECGCMNSVGFYEADMEKIVLSLNDYMKQNLWKYKTL